MKATEKIQELSNKRLIEIAPSIGQVKPYHDTSEIYSFVPTIEAVNFFRDDGWIPVQAGQSGTRDLFRNGFQKHMIRFTKPDLMMGEHRADIVMYNSHDGGAAFKLLGGFFKFVCENGIVTGNKVANFTHRHVGFDTDKFIKAGKKVHEKMLGAGKDVEDWKAITLKKNEQGVYAEAACSLLYDGNQTFEPSQLLELRRQEDKNPDLWTTFNVVQENIIKGGLAGKSSNGRRTMTRGITSIDRDRKVNQSLWDLNEVIEEHFAA